MQPAPPPPDMPPSPATPGADAMTLMEHLFELRRRLTLAIFGVLIGMVGGLFLVYGPPKLVDRIILAFVPQPPDLPVLANAFLALPQGTPPVQAVGTAETFTSYMMVVLVTGVVLAMPWIVYQLFGFIAPGLLPSEERIILRALPFVTFCFVAGVAFGWFVTVPAAIGFLLGFSGSPLIAVQPTLSDFLQTVTVLILMNGIVFEMPVIVYVLAYVGATSARQLGKYRRYALVIVVIVAAIITPTGDPINLLLLAVPMYLLYELGIILARFTPPRQ